MKANSEQVCHIHIIPHNYTLHSVILLEKNKNFYSFIFYFILDWNWHCNFRNQWCDRLMLWNKAHSVLFITDRFLCFAPQFDLTEPDSWSQKEVSSYSGNTSIYWIWLFFTCTVKNNKHLISAWCLAVSVIKAKSQLTTFWTAVCRETLFSNAISLMIIITCY